MLAITAADTPIIRRVNPDVDIAADYRGEWREVASPADTTNPYRVGWEHCLRHLVTGAPLVSDLSAGIRDVQLAEACYRSIAEQRWIEMPAVTG